MDSSLKKESVDEYLCFSKILMHLFLTINLMLENIYLSIEKMY